MMNTSSKEEREWYLMNNQSKSRSMIWRMVLVMNLIPIHHHPHHHHYHHHLVLIDLNELDDYSDKDWYLDSWLNQFLSIEWRSWDMKMIKRNQDQWTHHYEWFYLFLLHYSLEMSIDIYLLKSSSSWEFYLKKNSLIMMIMMMNLLLR